MGGLRWTAAGCLLISILKIRGEPLPARGAWPSLVVQGILLLGFGNGGVVWAEQSVPSGLTAVLVSTTPFWMVGVERLLPDGESVHPPPCRRPPHRVLRNRAAGLAGDSCGRLARLSRRRSGDAAGVRRLGGRFWAMPAGGARTKTSSRAWPSRWWRPACASGSWRWPPENGPISDSTRGRQRRSLYLLLVGSIVGFSAYAYALEAPADRDGLALRVHQSGDRRPARHGRAPRAVQRTNCRGMRRRARGHRDRQEH